MKHLDETKWPETFHESDETRDVLGRDRDETETRRWYVSRPRRRDRDHIPDSYVYCSSKYGI